MRHHHHHEFPHPEHADDLRAALRDARRGGFDETAAEGRGRRGGRGVGGGPRAGFGPGGGFGPRAGFDPQDEDDPRRGFDRRGGFDPRGGFGPGGGPFGPDGVPEGFDPRFGGPQGRRGRGRGRAPRGDVRTAVLLLLAEEPMHGYQLMRTIAERTGGRWSPSPGAIYPTLSQLEDEGLVSVSQQGGRKLASLTDEGRAHVEENRGSWADPFPAAPTDGEENTVDLRTLTHELMGAVREVGRSASDAQVRAAAGILADAKRSLYRVLAGDVEDAAGDAPADDAAPEAAATEGAEQE